MSFWGRAERVSVLHLLVTIICDPELNQGDDKCCAAKSFPHHNEY